MLFAIIAVWLGYKKGRDSGRSGLLWGLISGSSFISAQLLTGVGVALIFGLGVAIFDWNESLLVSYQIVVSIASIAAGFVTTHYIFKYLDRRSNEGPESLPPPPPTFNQSN